MKHILLLLLMSLAPLAAQDLITEADTIWTRSYGYMTDANFSPDGSRLAVTEPGAYYVYDSFTGEELFRVFENGTDQYLYTNFIDNDNLILRKHGSAIIHNITTNEITQFQEGESLLTSVSRFTLNRKLGLIYFIAGNLGKENRRVEVWDYNNMRFIDEFLVSTDVVRLAISKDKNGLAVITRDEGLDDKWWNLELYDISEDGLPKNKQVLLEKRTEILEGSPKEFVFDETGTKLKLPLASIPALYDLSNNEYVNLEIVDYYKGGYIHSEYFFYFDFQAKLRVKNLNDKKVEAKSDILGDFITINHNHFLFGSGKAIYLFNKSDVINPTSIEAKLLPLEINASFIAVESGYEIQLLDISGNNYSDLINNKRIDRSRLPNGTYFLTIQKGDYNKVFKFIEVK